MRKTNKKRNPANRFALIISVLLLAVAVACSGRKNPIDTRNIIPEKEMPSIITDLYITDGLLTLPNIINLYSHLDTLSCYKEVLKKHGYTKENMDKTLKYYFVKNPRQLIKIYDQVLAILSEMEARYEKEIVIIQSKSSNYWTGDNFYSFPDPSGNNSTDFDITISNAGSYTLSFIVTLYPDDQSVNPRLTAYTCHPDSIETGKRRYLKTLNYIKDGQPHTYMVIIKARNKSDFHLRGSLFNYDNYPDVWGKHLSIAKISYSYSPL